MWTQNSKKRVKKQLWDVNSELQEKNKKKNYEMWTPNWKKRIKKRIVRCEIRIARKRVKKQNCEMWTQNCKKRLKKQLLDVNSELQEKSKKKLIAGLCQNCKIKVWIVTESHTYLF